MRPTIRHPNPKTELAPAHLCEPAPAKSEIETQNYQHLSVWDFNLIKDKLLESGFKNPSEKKYLEGANKDILLDMEFRSPETLYVESCA